MGTFDNADDTLKVYLNGVLVGSDTNITDTPSTFSQSLEIGKGYTNEEFDGVIDQVRIYDYARTPAQIAWDYNRGKPVGHWKMDKGSGTTVYEFMPNLATMEP